MAAVGLPGEVQPQVPGAVVGARLQRLRAEHLAQRGVHDVGARVRLARRQPPLAVDLGGELRTLGELALEHPHLVHDQALDRALHVEHLGAAAVPVQRAGVGDLAAGLGVERRAVEHHAGDLARPGRRGRAAVLAGEVGDQAEDAGVGAQGVVGTPVGGAVLGEQPAVGQDVDRAGALGAGVGAGVGRAAAA